MSKKPDVDAAYALSSPQDVKDLYQSWAETYDQTFIAAQGYQAPARVIDALIAQGGTGPVLDVGAGTGHCGALLRERSDMVIDGIDLSPDMLAVARRTVAYRKLVTGDITTPITGIGPYNAIISAGTFTFGHVGPEGLPALFDLAAKGCLFVLGVNAAHFAASGFEDAFDTLGHQISDLRFEDVRIYGDRADGAHRHDMARLVIFRTL